MPDAWDDDWVTKAESSTSAPGTPPSSAKLSKAERRRQQAKFNKQIWERENSERPEDNYFLQTKGIVPLKSEFKPQMTVLSRKPTRPIGTTDPSKALSNLNLEDDDEDEDDQTNKNPMTPEERLQKAQREREEKQKAYEERRRQLFGSDEPSSAPRANNKSTSSRNHSRVKATNDSRPSSAASNKNRQLFDPNESTKPESLRSQSKQAPSTEMQPVREPRGPDGSGRGGFGFSPRGGRST